jgi:hypothetical protein
MNIDYKLKNIEDLWKNLNKKTKEPLIVFFYKDLNICKIENNEISIQQYKQIRSNLIENYSIIEVNVIDNSFLEEMFWGNK